jgi:hypothetical protein
MLTIRGGSRHQFILHNGAIKHLEVTSRGHLPNVMIQFRAKTLYEHDLVEVNAIVERIADHFLEPGFKVKVSSFDLALDFQYEEWMWPETEDSVCRARKDRIEREGGAIASMTFGKRHASLQIQIYDKSREVKVHHKEEWMEGVWVTKKAYDNRWPVIRVELRFARDLLKDFDIETITDLQARVGDLVRYAVGDKKPWFRVAASNSRHRKADRREAAPWWEELRRAFLEGLLETGRTRQRSAWARRTHPNPPTDPPLPARCLKRRPRWSRTVPRESQVRSWHRHLPNATPATRPSRTAPER